MEIVVVGGGDVVIANVLDEKWGGWNEPKVLRETETEPNIDRLRVEGERVGAGGR